MKLKNLPYETRQAFQVIKKFMGTDSNNIAFTFCVAVAADKVHKKIVEEELAKAEKEKADVKED